MIIVSNPKQSPSISIPNNSNHCLRNVSKKFRCANLSIRPTENVILSSNEVIYIVAEIIITDNFYVLPKKLSANKSS